jgi:hypothetical protein
MATGSTEFIDLSTADPFLQEVWSNMASVERDAKYIFATNVDRSGESELKSGQILRRQHISTLAARSKSANAAITYETVAESEDTVTINNYYYAAFALEDVIKPMVKISLIDAYMPKVGIALAKQLDSDVAALIDDGTITQNVGTMATGLTYDNFVRADQYLNDDEAPEEDRAIILSHAERSNCLKQDQFVNSQYVKLQEGRSNTGLLGGILGYPVFVTGNTNGSNSAGHDNVMLHKSAIMLIQQIKPIVKTDWDIDYFAAKVAALETYGMTINTQFVNSAVWMKGL